MSTSDPPPDPLKPDPGWVRYLGALTALGLAVLLLAGYVLPSRAAAIVGGIALFFVTVAGGQFLFHVATLTSKALHGRRRTGFQVAVALATPVAFILILASRADAVPVATLWRMVTPWLLIPLGIIAWVCWFAGGQLDREHPFRGFLIAATVFGVLCFFWSAGIVTEPDYDGEGCGRREARIGRAFPGQPVMECKASSPRAARWRLALALFAAGRLRG
jgi:hypothetical protein